MPAEITEFKWIDIKEAQPLSEVLAINHQDAVLVGTCSQEGSSWICEGGSQRLEGVTHYVHVYTLLSLHELQMHH